MLVTLIFYLFYLEGHITKKFTLKNKKKSMDKKLDTPSTLRHGLRDQIHICTRLRRDVSRYRLTLPFSNSYLPVLGRKDVKFELVKFC
jgi:hypothetical protein